jgi:hypothetical protein
MRLTPLPADFINPYVVTVNYTNVETLVTSEARRATKREIYNVNMHAWNSPTSEEPIYIVERDINSMFWLLYVGDLDTRPPGVLEDTIEVRIWYVAAINDIEDVTTAAYVSDTEQVLPADTEEMVLNYAVLYCMQNMDRGLMFSTIQAETERLKALYRQSYQVDKQRVGSLIPSKEGVN